MGNTYPNHKGNYYYRNHTLYHIGTLDPLGVKVIESQCSRNLQIREVSLCGLLMSYLLRSGAQGNFFVEVMNATEFWGFLKLPAL